MRDHSFAVQYLHPRIGPGVLRYFWMPSLKTLPGSLNYRIQNCIGYIRLHQTVKCRLNLLHVLRPFSIGGQGIQFCRIHPPPTATEFLVGKFLFSPFFFRWDYDNGASPLVKKHPPLNMPVAGNKGPISQSQKHQKQNQFFKVAVHKRPNLPKDSFSIKSGNSDRIADFHLRPALQASPVAGGRRRGFGFEDNQVFGFNPRDIAAGRAMVHGGIFAGIVAALGLRLGRRSGQRQKQQQNPRQDFKFFHKGAFLWAPALALKLTPQFGLSRGI